MFGRKRPAPLPTTHPDVRHFRRQLRNIEWALSTVDARTDADVVRRLADDHATYRACLKAHGVIHPAPRIDW